MSTRIGAGVFSAKIEVDVARDASAVAADTFMKRRRSIDAYSACTTSVPDAIGVSENAAGGSLAMFDGKPERRASWRERITRPTVRIVTRREAAKIISVATAGLMLPTDASRGQAKGKSSAMLT